MSQSRGLIRILFQRSVLPGTVALILFAAGTSLRLQAAPLVADHVKGQVEQRFPGDAEWQPASSGALLPEGSQVRTGDRSEVELISELGHHFHVESNTTLNLTTLHDDNTKVYLSQGKVLSKVHHLQGLQQFSVQTPTAVCAVRGTEFLTGADENGTSVQVYKGIVGLLAQGSGNEVAVHAGQSAAVLRNGNVVPPHTSASQRRAAADSPLARAARHEVGLDMTRNQVMAAAVAEIRLAEYREGKTTVDAQGDRVRLEEYVMRPAPNQFKLVALDQRDKRFDYFFYQGTFNKALPSDLSVALKQLPGSFGSTAPDYYLTSYEMGQSNTRDSVHDTASGGHLVSITINANGDYVLTDPSNPANTRTVTATQLQSDGTYKVYDPLSDSFMTATASQLSTVDKFSMYLPSNGTYKDLAPGDTFWKTRFNSYQHQLDDVTKITYSASGSNNVLASTLDANYTYAGGFVLPVTTIDPKSLDVTITNYYGDGTFESYRTVLIDDLGHAAPQSAFAGVSTGAQYNNELLKWNYEQEVTASEFQGRKIDLVVEPKIFINSGLIE